MDGIFAIGSNGSGQLGIGHHEDVSVPKPVQFHPSLPSEPIVQMAAGGNHSLLLFQSGKLYWSGDAASGAVGIASPPSEPVFQEVQLGEGDGLHMGHVDSIAATWEASFVVARDHQGRRARLFSCGTGMKGELGSGELIVRTPTATRIQDFPPADTEIVCLAACMGHVVAVLSSGDAYGWGNCRKSQIGPPGAVVHSPRKIEGIGFAVTRAVCAKESTCFFGEPESGNIRVLGSDKWELCSKAPAAAPEWTDVGASWGNFYILGKDGSLLSWGRDDHGQLPPPNLPRIQKIATGSEHVIALSVDGDVLAWGWGEHGNCGPQVEREDVKGHWNVIVSSKFIPPGCQIYGVGAGCATSWVCIKSG
ncbi:regulator of chromosome condensation (RCC1) repeat domain-containing protein [Hirsutella rhossiliensis]|uniref:Regulator of chromosome condensation (RCC1) repeat domain-containing protein n=1 Tax=Hirsutella rhossiliensis TaxID=111463 RepID=A0A9P8MRZ5_9HYPO|nr:regulator of chromosome condensation (RCC1) repeat domain-containing protein [Hirsutella rhossiliensis]KAH0960120.1 regulator of chromosome condensation (RCC1) repeat domain-containing protein [Hirsutella rhossiliensis]